MIIILIFIILLLAGALVYFVMKSKNSKIAEESFLSVVNHSFRTPLTRIKWMSDSLTEDMPRKEALDLAHNLSSSVNRLLEIIDTLSGVKDINSTASYDIKAVTLREIIEHSIEECRGPLVEKNIALTIPPLHNLPFLSIDTRKVAFVVHAVLENAILYSKDKGSININAELTKENLILKVEDGGIGLTPQDKSNIFTCFYRNEVAKRLNTEGMGISLYMSKEIMRRHNGKIYFTSNGPDQGSTFYISFPVVK